MASVRPSQSSRVFLPNFFFNLFFVFVHIYIVSYVTQTPQTTDSTRAVQGACYNQLATTLYTPAVCQQSRKQHHTRAVVCPRCITTASYILRSSCFCYRTLRSVVLRVSAAVIQKVPVCFFIRSFATPPPEARPGGEPCT